MAEHIQKTDTLNEGRVKLNKAIDDAESSKITSEQADVKATQALANSESTQTQLDTIVIDGDSSVEAAQARVDEKGDPHPTLKARIDEGMNSVNQQLAEKANQDYVKNSLNSVNQQLADEINTVNVNIGKKRDKATPITLNDADEDMLLAIQGGEGTEFNIESIPRDYSVTPKKTTFINQSENLFNKDTIKPGFTLDENTGEDIENSRYGVSEFISVKTSTRYTAFGVRRKAFYDDGYNFITSSSEVDGGSFTSSSTATYMKVVVELELLDQAQVNEGENLLPYDNYYRELVGFTNIDSQESNHKSRFIIDSDLNGVFNNDETYPDYTNWLNISSEEVYGLFDDLRDDYPGYITKQPLEDEYTGLEISAYHFKPNRPVNGEPMRLPKVFITTGTHGYEKSAPLNMYLMLRHICNKWQDYPLLEVLRFNIELIYIPIVNPFGWNGAGDFNRRLNSNQIDIARQFPVNWTSGELGDSTYGGTAPLTEIEALNVKRIFDENPDIDIFYDYHNFGSSPENYFIWCASASPIAQNLNEVLVKKMSTKWAREYTYIPENTFVGYSSTMYEGTMHNYAKSLGIEFSGTFETARSMLWGDGVELGSDSVIAGVEAITNFIIINLKELIK